MAEEKVKVRFEQSLAGSSGSFKRGDVTEWPAEEAKKMSKAGIVTLAYKSGNFPKDKSYSKVRMNESIASTIFGGMSQGWTYLLPKKEAKEFEAAGYLDILETGVDIHDFLAKEDLLPGLQNSTALEPLDRMRARQSA